MLIACLDAFSVLFVVVLPDDRQLSKLLGLSGLFIT